MYRIVLTLLVDSIFVLFLFYLVLVQLELQFCRINAFIRLTSKKDSRISAQRRKRVRAIDYYKGFKCLLTWGISRDNQLPPLLFRGLAFRSNQYYDHLQPQDWLDITNSQITTGYQPQLCCVLETLLHQTTTTAIAPGEATIRIQGSAHRFPVYPDRGRRAQEELQWISQSKSTASHCRHGSSTFHWSAAYQLDVLHFQSASFYKQQAKINKPIQ